MVKRSLLTFLFILFYLFSLPFFASEGENIACVRIIQTTDIHGQYSSYSAPGISSLAFLIERARKEAGKENTLYIDCGDFLQGTFESSADKGKKMMEFFNLLSCDILVPGNHELDFGMKNLLEKLSLFQGKILSCNWRFTQKNAPRLFSYTILQRGGIKIAVIGMSPRYMESWFSSSDLQGLLRMNAAKSFARFMPYIMKEKADLIILAMHEGEYASTLKEGGKEKKFLSHLFRQWPQIDIVLGGHTHLVSSGKKCYRGQWYVQAPALAGGIAVIDVKFDKEKKKLLSLRSEIRKNEKKNSSRQITSLLSPLLAETEKEGKRSLGYLPFAPSPVGRSLARALNNPFARLLGNALREATKKEIAFHGTMGEYRCRKGRITKRRLFLLTPYENTLSTIPLTPEECRKVIAEQCKNVRFGNFQMPSGLRFTRSRGKINKDLFLENGQIWNHGEKEVVFTSYVLSGAGGRFPFLAELAKKKRSRRKYLSVTVREAAEKYILKHYNKGGN